MESSRRPQRPVAPSVSTLLKRIKGFHDEAYVYVERGLQADENGDKEEALTMYNKSLTLITNALSVTCDHDDAKRLQDKMRKTKLQVEMRHADLLSTPPSYEESCSYDDESDQSHADLSDAIEVFHVPEGVQIFFITPQGYVSAPSYPSSMHVYEFSATNARTATNGSTPPAFLKVGPWVYPLQPGSSPSLETSYGAFVFPDTTGVPGSAVGLLLPPDVTSNQRKEFENLLKSLTAMHVQAAESEASSGSSEAVKDSTLLPVQGFNSHSSQHTSTTIAKGLVYGAQQISYGLNKGAEFSKVLIQKGSTKIMEKMTPEQKAFMCDERYKDGVMRVRQATHTAVQVSSWIVGKLGDATVALGRQVAPHIKSTCVGYLPKSMTAKDEVDGHSTLDSVVEVAAGGLKGFSTVYQGLEQAAKSLLRNLAEETVQLVDYKYGKDAGHLTEHTLYSVGNIAMTGYNAKHLGVRAMVKRTAKDTGRAMFEGEEDRTQPNGKESSEQLTEKMLTKEK